MSEATSRRSAAIIVAASGLLLLAALLACTTGDGSAATIKVPEDHATIQEALDAARAYDEVHVKFGTYEGRIHINKPLSLVGAATGDTIIRWESPVAGAVVTINSANVVMKNIKIVGGTDSTGIAGSYLIDTRLRSVTVEGCDEGVHIEGGTDLFLTDCQIRSTRYVGLHINGSIEDGFDRVSVSGSVFESNTGIGIDLWRCRGVELDGLSVSNNGRWGVYAYRVNEAHLRNSTVSGNLVGLKLERCTLWEVEDDTISRNIWEGIELNESGVSGPVEVRRNQINYNSRASGSSAAAISFVGKDASHNLVEMNHVEHNPVGFSFWTDELGCWDNTFYLNEVLNCVVAITEGQGAGPNEYWLNVFMDNGRQAATLNDGSAFHHGQLGNYWSDYALYYPNAVAMGLVWSDPYLVDRDGDVTDAYPLVYPYEEDSPVVDLGDDLVANVGVAQTISVWATDGSGIGTYAWTIDPPDGYRVALDRNMWQIEYTFKNIGDFRVTVTVTDHWGLSASDSIWVTVVDGIPPVAIAGPDSVVDLGSTVVLDGSQSSDNHGIGSIHWVVDAHGESRVYREPIVSLRMDDLGVVIATLFVVDYSGNTASDSVVIDVRDLSPPVAVALADITVSLEEEVTFDGSQSRDNVGVVDYRWTLTRGAYQRVYKGPVVTHVFLETGRYTLDLRVADATGQSDIDQVTIQVIDTEPPVASAGADQDVPMGTEVTFDATGSTDNVAITEVSWTFFYKGRSRILEGREVTWRFDEPGEYAVTLMVFDGTGNFDIDTLRVTVRDTFPPHATFSLPTDMTVGTSVLLDASRSTDNLGIVEYRWKVLYKDGVQTYKGVMVDLPIDGPGIYRVDLTVTDAVGNEDSHFLTFQVPPRASTAETPSWLVPGMVAAVGVAMLVSYVSVRIRSGKE